MPLLFKPKNNDLLHKFLYKILNMSQNVAEIIKKWLGSYDNPRFLRLVQYLKEKAGRLVII